MKRNLILSNSSPFSVFNDFEKEMNEMMGLWPSNLRGASLSLANFAPAYEVNDKGEHFMVSFDLPGMKKEDVNLQVKQGKLHVSGERKSEHREGDYSEKIYGRFERIISLPEGVDENDLEARYENGVLFIAIPKIVKEEKSKKIEIKDGEKQGIWSRLLGGVHKDKEESSSAA